jgi:hypothetical protein
MDEANREALFQMGSLRAGHRGPNWTLLEGHGVRAFEQVIRFTRPYRHTPNVEVAFNFIDMQHDGANPRLGVEAINVNTEGFQLRIFTWWDTHVHEVGATWMAIGEPA